MEHSAPSFHTRRIHAKAAWQARPKRERIFVIVLAILFLAVIFWFLIWTPVTRDLSAQNINLPKARAALVSAQKALRDTAGLSVVPIGETDAPDVTVARFAARFGLSAQLSGMQVNDQHVSCALAAVSPDVLAQWLDALAKDALLFPVTLTLVPLSQNNAVRADITFARPTP